MDIYYQHKIGQRAELKACLYLQKQGLKLIRQNYTCFHGEIDLIMRDKEDIVFIEVRCRSRIDYGRSAETITLAKQKKIIRAATHFLQKNEWLYKVCSRFDVIAIERKDNKWQLEWIKNAFWTEN